MSAIKLLADVMAQAGEHIPYGLRTRIDALLKTGGWIPVTPDTMPPEEFKDVLVLRRGIRMRGSWYTHKDGTVCWSIEGCAGHPHLVQPPTQWQSLPPLPEAK